MSRPIVLRRFIIWLIGLLATGLIYFLLLAGGDWPAQYAGLLAAMAAFSLAALLEPILERVLHPQQLIYRQWAATYNQTASQTPNLKALLAHLTQILCGPLHFNRVIIWLHQPEDNLLSLACFEGDIAAAHLADLPLDVDLTHLQGLAATAALPESALRQGLLTLNLTTTLPLNWGSELVGLIGLGDDRRVSPPGGEIGDMLPAIAGQLALVIKNAYLVARLDETQQQLQQAYRRTLDAQEEERRNLAVELHDDILSRLTTMGMTIGDSQRFLTVAPAKVRTRLVVLAQEIHYLNCRLREITQGLHPAVLADLGLIAALQAYMDSLAQHGLPASTPCTVDLTAQGFNSARLQNQKLERDLYYLTRQALDNALKHSQAEHIYLHLRWRNDAITVTVQDTGVGLKATPERLMGQQGHLGLLSMQERVLAWQGRLSFQTGPGQGTTIYARLPINQPSPNPTHLQAFSHYLEGVRSKE
jgi:signal transduction histidine kinase